MGEKLTTEKPRRVGDGTPGPGRPKGVPNKTTTKLKEAILEAAERSHPEGTIGYLMVQAQENPGHFMTLLGKVLPLQVNGPGEDGEHLHKVSADDAFARLASRLAGAATGPAGGADRAE